VENASSYFFEQNFTTKKVYNRITTFWTKFWWITPDIF
jgi:hypothetical protein